MEVVPCSRVAHLICKDLKSNVPDPDVIQRSKIQVADTWMDTFFRKIFYRRDTLAHFIRQVCVQELEGFEEYIGVLKLSLK